MQKFIAPRNMIVNGSPSPCECTDLLTCANCVQTNLLGHEKKFKEEEITAANIVAHIRRIGIRKTAKDLNVDDGTVRYWLKTKNVPQFVFQKYAGLGDPPGTSSGVGGN